MGQGRAFPGRLAPGGAERAARVPRAAPARMRRTPVPRRDGGVAGRRTERDPPRPPAQGPGPSLLQGAAGARRSGAGDRRAGQGATSAGRRVEDRDRAPPCHVKDGAPLCPAALLALAAGPADRAGRLVRDRAITLVDLASVRLRQAELDECCRLAGEALEVAVATTSPGLVQRVRDLRGELPAGSGSSGVKALDEQLASAVCV